MASMRIGFPRTENEYPREPSPDIKRATVGWLKVIYYLRFIEESGGGAAGEPLACASMGAVSARRALVRGQTP